jgi:hypothetical protein
VPIGSEASVKGVLYVLTKKAYYDTG